MRLNQYPLLLAYVNAWHNSEHYNPGSFLESFLDACVNADGENFELLKPALEVIQEKYPAVPAILARELHFATGYDYDENAQVIHKIATPLAYDVATREVLSAEQIAEEKYFPAGYNSWEEWQEHGEGNQVGD